MTDVTRRGPDADWLARTPSAALVIGGITCVQLGGALAVHLFGWVGPSGAVALRLLFAACILLAISPPRLGGRALRRLPLAAAFGLVLAGMTLSFYGSLHRIPLGIAVSLEFVGPLAVAVSGSRRPFDLVWVALAAGGILALTRGGAEPINGLGVALALLAGCLWAPHPARCPGGARVRARRRVDPGAVRGSVVTLPVGIATAGSHLLEPRAGPGLSSGSCPPATRTHSGSGATGSASSACAVSLEPAVAALAASLCWVRG
jgi:inner membrane transporter RhtA